MPETKPAIAAYFDLFLHSFKWTDYVFKYVSWIVLVAALRFANEHGAGLVVGGLFVFLISILLLVAVTFIGGALLFATKKYDLMTKYVESDGLTGCLYLVAVAIMTLAILVGSLFVVDGLVESANDFLSVPKPDAAHRP